MKLFLKSIKKYCLDLLFPISCLGCGKEGKWLCDNCFNTIPINQKFTFPQAEDFFNSRDLCANTSELDGILVASYYKNELLNKTIKTFKYKFVFDLAKPLGEILTKFLQQFELAEKNNFLLIPIPLHKKRLAWRGFNQSELIAKEIEKFFNTEINKKILKRIKYTPPQSKLKEKEREKNIKNAFELSSIPSQDIINKKIILIDDVTTTGSTLREAGKILKKAGFKQVWGLVLARG